MGKKKAKLKKRPAHRRAVGPRVPRKEPYSTERFGAVIERVKDQTTRSAPWPRAWTRRRCPPS